MDIEAYITASGGLRATHHLLAAGWTSHQLTAHVRRGTIVRVRHGWYSTPVVDEATLSGVRVGGQLGCVSAAKLHGLAVRYDGVPHVAVPRNGARIRSVADPRIRRSSLHLPDSVVHWVDEATIHGSMLISVPAALREMAMCRPLESVIAAADSALHAGLMTRATWTRVTGDLPSRLTSLLQVVDPKSESITESVVRFRLYLLGIGCRSQVRVAGVGRVDLLVGERLVLELDGRAFHADEQRFEADRRRDARLSTRGYRVLRFSYRQVFEHWSEVRSAIAAAIARGDHR
jgi:very-short-patch-repair endonuclease